jgi:hypothetical protein
MKPTMWKIVSLVSALLAASLTSHAQNLITNGSFEIGVFADDGDGWQCLQPGSTLLPGWTIISDDIVRAVNTNYWEITASDGSFHLDLAGCSDSPPHGGITQIIRTSIGQAYRLSLDLGVHNRPDNPDLGGPITVFVSTGFTNAWFTHDAAESDTQWRTYSLDFIAQTARTPIIILGTNGKHYIGVDNVSVVALRED